MYCGSDRGSILEGFSLLMDIVYIKEEHFEEIERIQRAQPYTHTSYNKNCDMKGPWTILAEKEDDVILITPGNQPYGSEGHCLFGVKREYLITLQDIRDIKIDKII